MKLLRLVVITLFYNHLMCDVALAVKEEPSEQQIEELKKKAKLKQYLGGLDEQDLKIQSPLLSVFRKMNPVSEPQTVEDGPSDD